NTRNNPIEDLGMHLPLICDRYELRDDVMPGAGEYRGGIGAIKVQRYLTDGFLTHESDRHEDVPWGFRGGTAGAGARLQKFNIASPDKVENLPAKIHGLRNETGDCIGVLAACGGGYGDPLARSPEQVREDVLDDYCTVAHAKESYGVVLDSELEIDGAATAARRDEMRAAAE
ncbi:MAG: hydantoinase B/oxoprolinase family protein, partial [Rhodospirillaceae bacterium]|nr:hydantoinase B/oxoprolinase family protein [Rhodospirillaceae bacterium]